MPAKIGEAVAVGEIVGSGVEVNVGGTAVLGDSNCELGVEVGGVRERTAVCCGGRAVT